MFGALVAFSFEVYSDVVADINGLGRVRSLSRVNYDFNDDGKDNVKQTDYRFQLSLKLSKEGSSSYLFFQPRFSKVAGDNTTAQSSGALNDPDSFDAHQAFIVLKKSKVLLKAGRQELNYGDQLVIGGVGWHYIGRSFDGYKVSVENNYGVTDVLMMSIKENGAEVDSDRDHALEGIYHSGKSSMLGDFDLYYLIDNDRSDKESQNQANVKTSGIRLKSKKSRFDYRLEYTSQNIEYADESEDGTQYDVELGYHLEKFRVAVESSQATENYKQLYPTAHKWLGVADLFKRQNISQTAVHFKYSFSDVFNFMLSHHMFNVYKKDSTGHKWMYSGAESADEKELGTEQDLTVDYKWDKFTKLQLVYSIFTPGKRFKEANNDDALSFSYFQLQTSF